jgi:hypothetical protein
VAAQRWTLLAKRKMLLVEGGYDVDATRQHINKGNRQGKRVLPRGNAMPRQRSERWSWGVESQGERTYTRSSDSVPDSGDRSIQHSR